MEEQQQQRWSARERRLLTQRIQQLGATEHEEIYKMLEHSVENTRNNNGVFINISCVPADVLDRIGSFVTFCMNNKPNLDEYDNFINKCKYNQSMTAGGDHMQEQHEQVLQVQVQGRTREQQESEQEEKEKDKEKENAPEPEPEPEPEQDPDPDPELEPEPEPEQEQEKDNEPDAEISELEDGDEGRRRDHTKFVYAKKKYAKRRVPDKKGVDTYDNLPSVLKADPYPITAWTTSAR
jgi:hypothetical protein